MRALPQDNRRHADEWIKAIAFVCLALMLFAAMLDRRNAVLDRIEAQPSRSAQPVAPPAPRELIQEMLTHD